MIFDAQEMGLEFHVVRVTILGQPHILGVFLGDWSSALFGLYSKALEVET